MLAYHTLHTPHQTKEPQFWETDAFLRQHVAQVRPDGVWIGDQGFEPQPRQIYFFGGFAVLCNVNAPMHDTGYLGIAMGSLRYDFVALVESSISEGDTSVTHHKTLNLQPD